jgi:hypothetical protein
MTLFLRRLDRLGRALARTQRDLELHSEAFAVFVKIWFAHTPSVAPDARKAAQTLAESRYRQFVDYVAQQFTGGRRFIDDLPRECLADEHELSALAATEPGARPETPDPP